MFTFPISRRQADRPAARRPRTRRPLVEDLEGRRLPSGIVGTHIGVSADKPTLFDLRVGAVMVGRRSSFGEIDGPQRRREGFSVLVNREGVKRTLVRDSDAGVEELHVSFPQNWQISERQP